MKERITALLFTVSLVSLIMVTVFALPNTPTAEPKFTNSSKSYQVLSIDSEGYYHAVNRHNNEVVFLEENTSDTLHTGDWVHIELDEHGENPQVTLLSEPMILAEDGSYVPSSFYTQGGDSQ